MTTAIIADTDSLYMAPHSARGMSPADLPRDHAVQSSPRTVTATDLSQADPHTVYARAGVVSPHPLSDITSRFSIALPPQVEPAWNAQNIPPAWDIHTTSGYARRTESLPSPRPLYIASAWTEQLQHSPQGPVHASISEHLPPRAEAVPHDRHVNPTWVFSSSRDGRGSRTCKSDDYHARPASIAEYMDQSPIRPTPTLTLSKHGHLANPASISIGTYKPVAIESVDPTPAFQRDDCHGYFDGTSSGYPPPTMHPADHIEALYLESARVQDDGLHYTTEHGSFECSPLMPFKAFSRSVEQPLAGSLREHTKRRTRLRRVADEITQAD